MKSLLILILIFVSNCNFETKKDTTDCFSTIEKEEFITRLLNNARVGNYLHLEINERNPIKLKESEFITKDLNIVINHNKALITDDNAITDLITLKFSHLDCKKNELRFSIFFKIENALIEGKAKKTNENNWSIDITREIEY